jgi:hypothetical protein
MEPSLTTYKEIASCLAMTTYKEIASFLTMTKTESHSCLAKTTYKEIASCAMTAKARRYLISPMKGRVLIRHCEKTRGTKSLLFSRNMKGFSWQSSKAHRKGDCFVPRNDENRESFLLRNDDTQGDCFVPRNDGKSLTLPHPSNEKNSDDSSLRENPWNENIIIL